MAYRSNTAAQKEAPKVSQEFGELKAGAGSLTSQATPEHHLLLSGCLHSWQAHCPQLPWPVLGAACPLACTTFQEFLK